MAGNSPEYEKALRVTVGRLVKIEESHEQGKYVALKFELFPDEEDVRQAYFEYVSALQAENESQAEQKAAQFFGLTHVSAFQVYERAQEMHRKADRKNARAIR
jgi:hypothetical protein